LADGNGAAFFMPPRERLSGINSTNDAVASAGTAFAKLTGDLGLGSGRSRGDQIVEYFQYSRRHTG
jgi:hypothetical protein